MSNTERQDFPLQPSANLKVFQAESLGIRLRSLVWLRWFAIIGQSLSVILVHYGLGFPLPVALCFGVIALSAVLNIVVISLYPTTRLLHDAEASLYLGFDILQLAVLLFLTGGIQNPFTLLFLAPVTTSASRLGRVNTIALVLLAFICVSVLAVFHYPLPWMAGEGFVLPTFYLVGLWIALLFGIGFVAAYAWRLAAEASSMSRGLAATQLVLAREQRLSALGSLAAAAAHELGTPLATIQLVAREMQKDLPKDSPMAEDAVLLRSQAERCRDILGKLSRSPEEEDAIYARLGLGVLLEEVSDPYGAMGVAIEIRLQTDKDPEPQLWRRPEIIHGLTAFVENAADYAHARVVVAASWTESHIHIAVCDDGPGFAPEILTRLGEPYVTSRPSFGRGDEHFESEEEAAHAGGMGLGFFIAKTLIERTGGQVVFGNHGGAPQVKALAEKSLDDLCPDFSHGAYIEISWPRDQIEADPVQGV